MCPDRPPNPLHDYGPSVANSTLHVPHEKVRVKTGGAPKGAGPKAGGRNPEKVWARRVGEGGGGGRRVDGGKKSGPEGCARRVGGMEAKGGEWGTERKSFSWRSSPGVENNLFGDRKTMRGADSPLLIA